MRPGPRRPEDDHRLRLRDRRVRDRSPACHSPRRRHVRSPRITPERSGRTPGRGHGPHRGDRGGLRRRGVHRREPADAGIGGGSVPRGITAGPDGNLWFTELERQPDRADHPGRASSPSSPPASAPAAPAAITAGPDGNLWFTERHRRPDRADHPGGRGHRVLGGHRRPSGPPGITAGPDGNLWFTERRRATGSGGSRRRARSPSSRRASAPRAGPGGDHRRPRRQPLVHRALTATGSGGSPRRGSSPSSRPASAPRAAPAGSPPGPTATSGSPRLGGPDRADHPGGRVTEFSAGISPRAARSGSPPGPTATSGSPSPGDRDRAHHPRRGRHRVRGRHQPQSGPVGITAGPDGNLWFTEFSGNRIGRITLVRGRQRVPADRRRPRHPPARHARDPRRGALPARRGAQVPRDAQPALGPAGTAAPRSGASPEARARTAGHGGLPADGGRPAPAEGPPAPRGRGHPRSDRARHGRLHPARRDPEGAPTGRRRLTIPPSGPLALFDYVGEGLRRRAVSPATAFSHFERPSQGIDAASPGTVQVK